MTAVKPEAASFFDDVDEYLPDGGREQDMVIADILKHGNAAYRKGFYEQAIKDYSKAYKLQSGGSFIILSNRSVAFYKLSQHLKKIPAAVSERHALYGLDPMCHAELALKDAEKALTFQSTVPKGYYRKGSALFLLERYEEARDSYLEGLQLDPTSFPLQYALQKVTSEIKDSLESLRGDNNKRAKIKHLDDFDCVLCLKLLYKPVTTPCGHTFCRTCLLQSMDHGNKCPICRVVLLLSPNTYPVSVTLKNIIEKNFPEEYAARKEEMDAFGSLSGNEILPLFVMDVAIPCEKMCLNIFEPRYRLMVRRVMEGNHRMGMVGIDPETDNIADIACEMEITECEPLADGRFYLEVEGRRRFNIIKTWEQDGCRVGQITWLHDAIVEDGPSLEDLHTIAKSTADLAKSWIVRARERSHIGRHNSVSDSLNEQIEGMPSTKDPELFSFWVAALMHLSAGEKLQLLHLTDTRKRLIQDLIFLGANTSGGCHLQ